MQPSQSTSIAKPQGLVLPPAGPSNMTDSEKIALARGMFKAWSYHGGVDMIGKFAHPDLILFDLHIGEHRGLEVIKQLLVKGLAMWPDMDYELGDIWVNDEGAAINWVMTGTVTEALASKYGAERVGRQWRSAGMSGLTMRNGLVVHEVDYYDPGAVRRSLGLHKS
jgi:CheY-like chemotaxis protein